MDRRNFLKYAAAAQVALPAAAQGPPAFRDAGRRQVLDLAGPWRLAWDVRNRGLREDWVQREPARALDIVVPSVWQQYVNTDGGIGWYYKTFNVPPEIASRHLRLRFHAVDYQARAWLNGRELGVHEGGYTPFEFDASGAVRAGENRLVVRVVDPGRAFKRQYLGLPGWERAGQNSEVGGIRAEDIPVGFQDWREGYNFGGIWQGVELIASDPIFVCDIFAMPDLPGSRAVVQVEIANTRSAAADARVAVEIRPWAGGSSAGGEQRPVHLKPGINAVQVPVPLAHPHHWSADDPFLYAAEASLGFDDTRVRFGMRDFRISPDGFFQLNGRRIMIKSAHYQSCEPFTLAFPPTPELARRTVAVPKEGGFNFMRLQGRPTTPSILDYADELGILVQTEPATSRMADTPNLKALSLREIDDLVRRDRNRPCVGIWNMINEQAVGMKYVADMAHRARELDPTRLITESAGGNSKYYQPGSFDGVSYITEHHYPGAPLSEFEIRYLGTRGMPGVLHFLSEFGYGALTDIDAVIEQYGGKGNPRMEDFHGWLELRKEVEEGFARSEAKQVFGTLAAYREASQTLQANTLRRHVTAMRSNPHLAGYNVVQLFDSNANETDGLVDFFKNHRKKGFAVLQELNRPLVLGVQAFPFNPRSGGQAELIVSLANEMQISVSKRLLIRVLSPSRRELFRHEQQVDASPWVSHLFEGKVPVGDEAGAVTFEAALTDGGRTLVEGRSEVTVFDPRGFHWPARGFAVFDPAGRWKPPQNWNSRPYDAEASQVQVVVAPEFQGLWHNPPEFRRLLKLADQVRRGSTLLFLGIPDDGGAPDRLLGPHTDFTPFSLGSVFQLLFAPSQERGGWGKLVSPYGFSSGDATAGAPVTTHPIFEGLPGPGLMDWQYGNLLTNRVLDSLFASVENTGPVAPIYPLGSGRLVFCTLRILETIDRDALAEKLLSNMISYFDRTLPERLRPRTPREEEFVQFQQRQIENCYKERDLV